MARLFYVLGLIMAVGLAAAGIVILQIDATLVGSLGVSLLLAAFLLSLTGLLRAEGVAYLALNLAGAAFACLSSYMIEFLPFVLLEGAWAVVAAAGLVRIGVNGASGRALLRPAVPRIDGLSTAPASSSGRRAWLCVFRRRSA